LAIFQKNQCTGAQDFWQEPPALGRYQLKTKNPAAQSALPEAYQSFRIATNCISFFAEIRCIDLLATLQLQPI
jgi:hypothetical protein